MGQLQWMDYELLVPSLRFAFLSSGIDEKDVNRIVRDAQYDLYHPPKPFFAHIHVAYAIRSW